MSLLQPDLGLFAWTLVVFLVVLFLLKKFAWKPITDSLKNREKDIQTALDEAKKAREEMDQLKAQNEQILKEAREERDQILKQAKENKESIIDEAKNEAKREGNRLIEEAKESIARSQEKAFSELKAQVSEMAIEIATKVVKSELSDKAKQEALVEKYLEETKMN